MDFHFKDTEQISELEKKPYVFVLPTFGKSTTDPTYYEPQATRIANMRKSARSVPSLYDFTDGKEHDVSDVHTMLGRKPGLTNEEISQIATENAAAIRSDSAQAKVLKKQQEQAKQELKDNAKLVQNAIKEGSEGTSAV